MWRHRTRLVVLSALLVALGHLALAVPPAGPQAVVSETIAAESVRAAGALDRLLPSRAESIYRALSSTFDPSRAMEVVSFMDRFWRVAGNTGFAASIDHIESGLAAAGFRKDAAARSTGAVLRVEEYPNGGNGWERVRSEMTIVGDEPGAPPERVFDPVVDYIALCMNSFSTPPGGVTSPLVYAGRGAEPADYGSLDVKGAVVLADGPIRSIWTQAVRQRGAIGVISAAPPAAYTLPDRTPEVFQWSGVPYDDQAKAFGFVASRRVADRLKARLKRGAVTVRTTIETRFHPGATGRSLVAEIRGTVRPDERVVLVAHVQEPGANDDASGCGTLYEMARALQAAIASKAIAPPKRTIAFIWGDEMRASREWLQADAARAKTTRFMISLDMTGEDAKKTGGSFLIEKEPDPSAVWPGPNDPHTEWWGGRGTYKAEALRGSLLNDLTLAVCLRRARDTGWNVQTNPYEGGSDHTVFLQAGIPALLATHFTDRYYHTNLDRPDKTSPAEMGHVGIAMGTVAALLASTGDADALALTDLVSAAATRRLSLEAKQPPPAGPNGDDGAARAAERQTVVDAWKRWYANALEGLLALPVEQPPGGKLQASVRAAVNKVNGQGTQ